MKKLKSTKETVSILSILLLSAILNFANIGIEGYGNSYYAAGVKSMTMSLKNFFFVSFDPGSFVTIDKPPMGFWIQTIFAKIFGFSGWSIILPQAMAGVISVYLIYYLVKRSFGNMAGLISALCLAVTPVFVAASRNNTIDNLLVLTLLFSCLAITLAAEKGKVIYLYLSIFLIGIGFNIKMLEAYMIGPAIYITYLLSSTISLKKRLAQLVAGTIILFAVSLSWTIIVDLVPTQNRPFIGSSTNNSVMELIIGHNGLERLGLSGKSSRGFGGNNNKQDNRESKSDNKDVDDNINNRNQQINKVNFYENNSNGAPIESSNRNNQGSGPGGQGGIQGSFGGQTPAGITRLFSKNSLSDQIVWFLPLALLGFIASAIKEKLKFKLDNKRKVSLVLWFTWLIPEFIYFSYTTGLFHPYYLTMMAPPAAALAGIGIVTMWNLYKEGSWRSWFLPLAFLLEGATHMIMLSHFTSNLSTFIRNIILISLTLCFGTSVGLCILNILSIIKRKDNINIDSNRSKYNKLKRILAVISTISILVTPFIGSSAAITHGVNSTIPTAGLELLSNSEKGVLGGARSNRDENSKLVDFLKSNKTTEKYLLAVSSSKSADSIIIETGESVMALGGFSGSDNILTLDQFKEMVKDGEVRYVLTGGMGRGGSNEIMNWVTENGTIVPESDYKDVSSQASDENSTQGSNSKEKNIKGFEGNNSEKLYDLKAVSETLK